MKKKTTKQPEIDKTKYRKDYVRGTSPPARLKDPYALKLLKPATNYLSIAMIEDYEKNKKINDEKDKIKTGNKVEISIQK